MPEFFGDTPVINGKAYPYLDVQPRRYRLRLLNGSQARFYNLGFEFDGPRDLPFWVIGSDGGLLPKPAQKTSLLIAPGERFDVIVDFTRLPLGSTVMMTNDANEPYPDGDPPTVTDLMKINVNTPVPANDPRHLGAARQAEAAGVARRLHDTPGVAPRDIVLKENCATPYDNPYEVLLNGYHFTDPTTDYRQGRHDRDLALDQPDGGRSPDAHAPGAVPGREPPGDRRRAATRPTGRPISPPVGPDASSPHLRHYLVGDPISPAPEEMGYKDTVKAYPGYVTRVRAKFTLPWTSLLDYDPKTRSYGSWVYHCHILEHEENDMMRPFEVVK